MATSRVTFESGPDGTKRKVARAFTDEELLARGATPESLRKWRSDQAARQGQLRVTNNYRLLLDSAAARKNADFSATELAKVPLLEESLDKLDAEFARAVADRSQAIGRQEAWLAAKALFQKKQDDLLKEAFGAKAQRLQQLRVQFIGLPTVLYESAVADAVGISIPYRSALTTELNKRLAALPKPSPAALKDAAAGKPTKEKLMSPEDLHEIAGAVFLELLTPEQRKNWEALIGSTATFPRPIGWSIP